MICPVCGGHPASEPCFDAEDAVDTTPEPVVAAGSLWTTRGEHIPRRVTVLSVDRARGWATVEDEDGVAWCERESEIEARWSRRSVEVAAWMRAS